MSAPLRPFSTKHSFQCSSASGVNSRQLPHRGDENYTTAFPPVKGYRNSTGKSLGLQQMSAKIVGLESTQHNIYGAEQHPLGSAGDLNADAEVR
jgi:hypothetical protein